MLQRSADCRKWVNRAEKGGGGFFVNNRPQAIDQEPLIGLLPGVFCAFLHHFSREFVSAWGNT